MQTPSTREDAFLLALVKGYNPGSEYAWAVKENWKLVSKSYFREIAKKLDVLEYPLGYNVWFNAGGSAVSGDIHLQAFDEKVNKGFHLFGSLELYCNLGFCIRTISKLGDYQGGQNMWLSAESMRKAELLAITRRYLGQDL